MPSFDEVNKSLGDEPVPTDMSKLADPIIERDPLPQPGAGYEFRLPVITLGDEQWDDIEQGGVKGFSYTFRGGQELVVVKAPRPHDLNKPVGWRVSNIDRQMKDQIINDMAYLLNATVPEHAGERLTGKPNIAWARALVVASGRAFRARVGWSANCNAKNDIYKVVEDDQGQITFAGKVIGKKGCGRSYALRVFKKRDGSQSELFPRWQKDDIYDAEGQRYESREGMEPGDWVERFDCKCGARIGAFLELREILPSATQADVAQNVAPKGNGQEQAPPAPQVSKAAAPAVAPAAPARPPSRRR